MYYTKYFMPCCYFALMCLSPLTMAHVRWFSEERSARVAQFEFDYIYLLLVVLAVSYCFFCVALNWLSSKRKSIFVYLDSGISLAGFEWSILKASIALMFVLNLVSQAYLAPNLEVATIGQDLARLLQIIVIIGIAINNVFFSVSLLVFLISTLNLYGFSLSVDYVPEFLGIALAFIFIELNRKMEAGKFLWIKPYLGSSSPSAALRLGIGCQLAILAVHNKFLNPDLGLQFLEDYPFVNFARGLGFTSFKDIHFIFSAGLAELCFGVLLMFNIATRFVASCVIFFFSVTSFIFGLEELVGHIPILVGLWVVALHGKRLERGVDSSLFSWVHKGSLPHAPIPSNKRRAHASI